MPRRRLLVPLLGIWLLSQSSFALALFGASLGLHEVSLAKTPGSLQLVMHHHDLGSDSHHHGTASVVETTASGRTDEHADDHVVELSDLAPALGSKTKAGTCAGFVWSPCLAPVVAHASLGRASRFSLQIDRSRHPPGFSPPRTIVLVI